MSLRCDHPPGLTKLLQESIKQLALSNLSEFYLIQVSLIRKPPEVTVKEIGYCPESSLIYTVILGIQFSDVDDDHHWNTNDTEEYINYT